jgi:hypothetical protein
LLDGAKRKVEEYEDQNQGDWYGYSQARSGFLKVLEGAA